jgi:hypothetical protein
MGAEPERERPAPAVNPLARLQTLADQVASALEFMAAIFGPPALPHLTVTPIPGTFGQGFPGLIYLSTLSYLKDRPAGNLATPSLDLFFDDVLQAHETAHQWWGNRVTTENYRDSWLMEALANYSALLYLEKRRGPRAVDQMLGEYRSSLLEKNQDGETVESAGPIVLGQRLQSSLQPAGWRAITYGKGSWILHMLRHRMGDQRFLRDVGRYRQALRPRQHHHRAISKGGGSIPAAKIGRSNSRGAFSISGSTAPASPRSSSLMLSRGRRPRCGWWGRWIKRAWTRISAC